MDYMLKIYPYGVIPVIITKMPTVEEVVIEVVAIFLLFNMFQI